MFRVQSIILLLTVALASLVAADCSRFRQLSKPTEDEAGKYTENHYGVYTADQIQQASPAVNCQNVTDGAKHIDHFVCDFANYRSCTLRPHGNGYARAATNLSATAGESAHSLDAANTRVIALALAHVKYPNTFGGLNAQQYEPYIGGPIGNPHAGDCLPLNTTGYLEFLPIFYCVHGELLGCAAGGSPWEQDNTIVSVCVPFFQVSEGTGGPVGSYAIKRINPQDFDRFKSNPALTYQIASAAEHGLSSPRYSVLGALVFALAVFMKL